MKDRTYVRAGDLEPFQAFFGPRTGRVFRRLINKNCNINIVDETVTDPSFGKDVVVYDAITGDIMLIYSYDIVELA